MIISQPIIAIDIGGSKTDVIFYMSERDFIFKRLNFGAKYRDLPENIFKKRIEEIRKAIKGYRGRYLLSVAGLDCISDIEYWNKIVRAYFSTQYKLVHDVKASLYTASLGGDGVIVIAGTGSNVYGEYKGLSSYSGDWGWRLGDDFSGYRLGRDFLNYILRMYDGRMKKNNTYKIFLDFIGMEEERLIDYLYSLDTDSIASFTKFICELSYEDHHISKIIRRISREAIRSVKAVVNKLKYPNPIIHRSGGLFKCNYFNDLFLDGISKSGYKIGEYVEFPVIGLLLMGLKEEGYSDKELARIKYMMHESISRKPLEE